MSNINSNSISAQSVYTNAGKGIATADEKISTLMGKAEGGQVSELEMMQLNMAVSQRTTLMSLFSSVIKNLTDTEKQVANKI